ncbi:MAG: helix-turn-helix domain-containing protein [Verrucomicrobiales bacterium]|nr:helix-turn-helix domain-containing protein [Verrucomicrobiales bacterium]
MAAATSSKKKAKTEKIKPALDRQFADFVRAARGNSNYADFAAKIKVTSSTVHRLENCKQSITLRSMEKILNHLGRPVSSVFRK